MAWMTLKAASDFYPSNIVSINDDEFIVSYRWNNIIDKYNIISNKWSIFSTQNGTVKNSEYIGYNAQSKTIYTTNINGLRIIDVDSNNYQQLKFEPLDGIIDIASTLIVIDSVCHSICGRFSDSHYIFDDKQKDLKHVHTFNALNSKGWTVFGIVYASKTKQLFCVGGFRWNGTKRSDQILKYSLDTGTWNILDVRLHHPMNHFGVVITKDQRYIILLGGYATRGNHIDCIYIIDLFLLKVSKSKVKLPFKNVCRAIIMNNQYKNELLVNGYIRQLMYVADIHIPLSLISVFCVWHSMEYIHVINPIDNGKHWQIYLDAVFIK